MVVKGGGIYEQAAYIIYHEQQGNDRNCGKHVINHIFQKPVCDIQTMRDAAARLDNTEAAILGYNPTSRKSENADSDGFFNIQVLEIVLLDQAIILVPFRSCGPNLSLNPGRNGNAYLLNVQAHWYCVLLIKGVWFELNSLKDKVEVRTEDEISILVKHVNQKGMVYLICKQDGSELPIADIWVHDVNRERQKLKTGCHLTTFNDLDMKYKVVRESTKISHHISYNMSEDQINNKIQPLSQKIELDALPDQICVIIQNSRKLININLNKSLLSNMEVISSSLEDCSNFELTTAPPIRKLIYQNKLIRLGDNPDNQNKEPSDKFFERKGLYRLRKI